MEIEETSRTKGTGRPDGTAPACATGFLLFLALVIPAAAQFDAAPHRDDPLGRYQETRYGATLDEWVQRLGDPSADVRLGAVKSMAASRDPRAVPHLIEATLDTDPRVAIRAIDTLGELRATEATEFLAERLFHKSTSDRMRHQILGALAEIGDSRALRPILAFVDQSEDHGLRGTAIFALGEIGDTTVLDDVKKLADEEPDPKLRRLTEEAAEKIAGRPFEPTPRPSGVPDPLLRPIEP